MASTAIITGKGIISYPCIFEPKENLSGVMKYSCSILFDKKDTATITAIKGVIEIAKARGKSNLWSNKLPKFRYEPLRDGDTELETGEKAGLIYKGKYFLNCSSNEAPGVVGPDAKVLMDQKLIYAGCFVRAQLNAFPYKSGSYIGIGWGLNGIMLVSEGPRLDGRVDPEEAFANFAEVEKEESNEDLM